MLQTRRAEPQTEARLFRDELGAGMDHLRRAMGHARAMAGPGVRAARQRWGSAAGRINRSGKRGGGRGRVTFPVGMVMLGVAAAAVAAMVVRRRRRRWEYDAELALEEVTEGGADAAPGGDIGPDEAVPDEAPSASTDQMPT